jgi:glyoxylase-like metal-dependent hydrolase (beta-lactamase superfamily II)
MGQEVRPSEPAEASGDTAAASVRPTTSPEQHVQQAGPDDVIVIDTLTAGLTGVTAGYLLPTERPVLVECGPALSIGSVLDALEALGLGPDDLTYLVLTHIHLDHAGGAGDLLAAFPKATAVVSPLGARHLSDPTRLNASARQVYGPLFDQVYGACTPIDAERIRTVEHGEVLELGGGRRLELLDTPGHAKHHIGVFDPDLGALFSGDSVGVRLQGMPALRPATPPSDFNFETMLESLDVYRERAPASLYLAHYGAVGPASEVLDEAEERVRQWLHVAEAAWRAMPDVEDEVGHIALMLEMRFEADLRPEAPADDVTRQRLEILNDTRSNAAGLLRYLQRREAGTLTRLG